MLYLVANSHVIVGMTMERTQQICLGAIHGHCQSSDCRTGPFPMKLHISESFLGLKWSEIV